MGGGVKFQERGNVKGYCAIEYFVGGEEGFECHSEFDMEPVELLKNRDDGVAGACSDTDLGH